MKFRTLKILRVRREARKIKDKQDKWMRSLSLFLMVLLFTLAWCGVAND
jgi:hypothetical protein